MTRIDSGREPVWRIAPQDEHQAAFYRNTIIHAFLETSIVELSLAYAARVDGDRLDAFWRQAMRLRDLLKFDFYFADSAAFREHIADEMSWHPDWEAHVAAGGDEIDEMLHDQAPLMAQRHAAAVLRGLRDRRRRTARRTRRDRREGADQAGARRRASVHRAAPGAQRRVGVRAAVRHGAPGGRRPESLDTRQPTWTNGGGVPRELRGILRDMDKVEQISREQFYTRERSAAAPAATASARGPAARNPTLDV